MGPEGEDRLFPLILYNADPYVCPQSKDPKYDTYLGFCKFGTTTDLTAKCHLFYDAFYILR